MNWQGEGIMPLDRRLSKTVIMFIILWGVLFGICFSASKEEMPKFPDLFAHNNIILSPEHTLGRLMVAGGDAVVDGKVNKEIVVIDGNLTIKSGATVTGRILVLGGSAVVEQGANNKYSPRIIAPQGHPLVPILVSMILFSGGVSLIILPFTFWVIGHLFIKTSWYTRAKEVFLKIERRWPVLYIAASLGISAFMLAVFTMLAWETLFYQKMGFIDDSFVWLIRYYETPLLDKIMIIISDIGFGISYIVIVALSF
jgi:undecaprenyl-diphosphatase